MLTAAAEAPFTAIAAPLALLGAGALSPFAEAAGFLAAAAFAVFAIQVLPQPFPIY